MPPEVLTYGAQQLVADDFTNRRRLSAAGDPKTAANWVMGDLMATLKVEGKQIGESPVTAERLGELVALIQKGEISGKLAKEIFPPKMFAGGEAVSGDYRSGKGSNRSAIRARSKRSSTR